ncbi:ABC transporter substrate-binding protein [Streptacidiphilus jiangxiensis]|uniref:Multiple sugar transport system substrate-binding protein n=1 Tax=Streptacidiphilus jiangxiensis TaxID=235985 RepID=A0A1H7NC72_STRJI|nr:extracellular solute-binding protein [Streptacidiphilus jiangxiensis]SEL21103.1 multiple sugar transport system substrate-binding protein [Streptacidiphilus jiangxiensis]
MPTASPRPARVARTAAALTASAVSLAVLTACGSSGSGPSAAPAAPGKPVSLTFWGWAKGTADVVAAFNASHKDVHVDFQQIPSGNAGGYAKIADAEKAGNAPDLFNVEYAKLPEFVSQGYVQDITKAVPDSVRSQYLPQTMGLTTLGGETWGLPLDAAPQALFYRKDLFGKAGITTAPTTWADFRADAVKLKAAEPSTRIATFFPDDPSTLEALSWQNDAQWFGTQGDTWKVNLKDAGTAKVAAYWQDMISSDLVNVMPSFSQQWTSSLVKGDTAAYLGAAWGGGVLKSTLASAPGQSGQWAVAPIPSWDGQPASGMLGGTTFAVSKASRNTAAALEFAEWATTTTDGIKARIGSGTSSAFPADPSLVPVAKSAFDTTFYGGQDIYGVFVAGAASIKKGWTWGPAMGTTNTSLTDSFGKLSSGGTLAGALDGAQSATVNALTGAGLKVTQ